MKRYTELLPYEEFFYVLRITVTFWLFSFYALVVHSPPLGLSGTDLRGNLVINLLAGVILPVELPCLLAGILMSISFSPAIILVLVKAGLSMFYRLLSKLFGSIARVSSSSYFSIVSPWKSIEEF